jgi:chromate transporter
VILLQLAGYFALLSLVSVGGIPSVMPEMQRLVVDVHRWMSAAEFTQLFAVAQAAPGPNVLVTALVGWKVAGALGGAVALGAFCGPAAVLSYAMGGFWDRMRDAPWRKIMQRSLVPITVAFIASGGYVLATPNGPDWQSALIAAASASALVATRLNPLWFLSAGGVAGYFLF